ncbi:Lactoylglutathione lyase family protein / glyoxalase I family protein isoform 2 [Theobroma cacao]|uniref:Lactoylglutathione lyase family protein / glyoxalase I family protein isoform 2 n=1 Tax=Theobroma cacao TaxID=3641 RepID=A0A061H0B1_THECC|nr:Lactoylglutathione lyase family protein / glyoxalase I family protein isoform 2 [Theobroma cacao]EOY34474.1 Lactoylglutathione lyase family protein / glyoxalase I family protein isoform 2 [Theobroma cacao]
MSKNMALFSITAALSRCSLLHLTRQPCLSPSLLSFSFISKQTHQPKDRNRFRLYSMASSDSKESAANNPGLQSTPDEATKGYFMQQTMLRIKDPKVSLDFYSRVLGMSLLKRIDVPELKFTLYFLGYEDVASAPRDPIDRTVWTFGKPATVELTHLMLPTVIGVQKATLTSKDITMAIQILVALGILALPWMIHARHVRDLNALE